MLDGYENADPTTAPPAEVKHKPLVRPIPVISQRILNHIDALEKTGETARHSSFVVIPGRGIWRKMGNKTFYRLFNLRYMQHDKKKNGIQEAINKAKSRVFVKDSSYTVSSALNLATGISLEGESMPQLTNVEPTAPENITFTTNANGDTGTVLTTTGSNDCFTGNLLRTVSITNFGLANFTNGFNIGAANKLGISNSLFARILYSNVTTPLNVMNFQMLRLDQHYAWCPSSTGNFILAQNNHTWYGGNSYWTDMFAHGFKNVNGAIKLVAVAGVLNLIEAHRLQVNMQDGSFNNSTSGYAVYLQGQVSITAQCNANTFHALNLEGTPLKAVRIEDYSFYNFMHIALDNLSGGGFDFSLKKNASSQAPLYNTLLYTNTQVCAVESDSLTNFLISAGAVSPPGGSYPAGISGVGIVNAFGATFTTLFGGGNGQSYVGACTANAPGTQTNTTVTIATGSVPQTQEVEVGAELQVTAYTSGTIQIQASFTDRRGVARTIVLPVNNNGTMQSGITATGYYSTPTMKISTSLGSAITVATIGSFIATYTPSGIIRAASG
jgi:hypothetical protein